MVKQSPNVEKMHHFWCADLLLGAVAVAEGFVQLRLGEIPKKSSASPNVFFRTSPSRRTLAGSLT
jgi:hypothetical protein